MGIVRGRAVRIDIAASYGLAVPVSGVTVANPAAVSAIAHGLSDGTAGYFSDVVGMVQIEGQGAQVTSAEVDSFVADGLNTLNYSGFSSGNFTPATSWATLAEATSYSFVAEDAARIDRTTILDVQRQQVSGLLGSQVINVNSIAQTSNSAALSLIESAAHAGDPVMVRITHRDNAVRIARAIPSFPGEDVQQGAVGTSPLQFLVRGFVLRIDAAPSVEPGGGGAESMSLEDAVLSTDDGTLEFA
jgi:hypothetical protein